MRTYPRLCQISTLLLIALLISPSHVSAHGVDYRVERGGEAVLVYFSSQHHARLDGVEFRVYAPGGRRVFASGNTDALGRAVFVPDREGNWRLLMATSDGHGAEVEVLVTEIPTVSQSSSSPATASGGVPATAAGIGYLFGLAGLLALWRVRRQYVPALVR